MIEYKCPRCGGDNIVEQELSDIELEGSNAIIYAWCDCKDCGMRFDVRMDLKVVGFEVL